MNRAGFVSFAFVLTACGGVVSDAPTADAAEPPPTAGASSSATEGGTVEIGGMFDVGGYDLYLECEGPADGITVVYLHGMGGDHTSAQSLPDDLTDHVRWCAYDRANAGRSDRVEERRLGSANAHELHALLDAAGVAPPYLLVGASHGGLIATLYAEIYPDDVAGMVLLDGGPTHLREIYALIPEEDRAAEFAASEANPENVEAFATVDEAGAMLDQLPDVPVTFMLAIPPVPEEPPHWPIEEIRALDKQRATEFVARFTEGRMVEIASPHYMEPAVPDAIVAEIDRMLDLIGA